jgi:hypothetical protein
MTNLKFIKQMLIFTIAITFIIECVCAGTCFCEKCFPSGPRNQTDLQITSIISKSTSDVGSKGCNFEQVKFLKGILFSKKSPNGKSHPAVMNCNFGNCSVADQCGVSRRLICETDVKDISSIYLKNLSIRC